MKSIMFQASYTVDELFTGLSRGILMALFSESAVFTHMSTLLNYAKDPSSLTCPDFSLKILFLLLTVH